MKSRLSTANKLLKEINKSNLLSKVEKHIKERDKLISEISKIKKMTLELKELGWKDKIGKDIPEDIYIFELTQCLSTDLSDILSVVKNDFYKINDYKLGKLKFIKRFSFYKAQLNTKEFISTMSKKEDK
jgi:hypothetical protein